MAEAVLAHTWRPAGSYVAALRGGLLLAMAGAAEEWGRLYGEAATRSGRRHVRRLRVVDGDT